MSTTSKQSSDDELEPQFLAVISDIDTNIIQQLALTARLGQSTNPPLIRTVSPQPRTGAFNIVYEIEFSDGLRWVIRIPVEEPWTDECARSMRLDISTQKYIASKTSIPIPQIHAASVDTNNPLRHPYTISDFVPGTNLCKVWNDPSWWTEGREKDRVLRSIARWMVELSSLEFDKIGRLDYDELTGTTSIVNYTSIREFHSSLDDSSEPFGPFTTTHAFSSALILRRRMTRDTPMLALLQLYLSALPDSRFDGPPFVLGHPDFDSQNILIDEAGNITGLIDWDGVDVGPRQLNALSYPSWLTVDWDPLFYGWSAEASPEDNQAYDSPSELANYRHMYLTAIDDLSEGKLTEVTRNSHILSTLHIALCNPIATSGIMDHIGKFVLGSSSMTYELEDAIKVGSWFALGPNPSTIAEVIVNNEEALLEGSDDPTDDRSDE